MKGRAIFIVGAALLAGYGFAKLPSKEAKAQPVTVQAESPAVVAAPAVVAEPAADTGPIHADWLAESDAPAPEADEADQSNYPVSLTYYQEPGHFGQTLTYAVLQAMQDTVVIESVDLNRGNCAAVPRATSGLEYPLTLKFGQSVTLQVVGCESILEATVVTPSAEYSFAGA